MLDRFLKVWYNTIVGAGLVTYWLYNMYTYGTNWLG